MKTRLFLVSVISLVLALFLLTGSPTRTTSQQQICNTNANVQTQKKEGTFIKFNHNKNDSHFNDLKPEIKTFISLLKKEYNNVFGIKLPDYLTINICTNKKTSKKVYETFVVMSVISPSSINIYKLYGYKKLLIFDLFHLAHELGHIAFYNLDDKGNYGYFSEGLADFLAFEVLDSLYKKQGKIFSKNKYFLSKKRNWGFKLFDIIKERSGFKMIGNIAKDVKTLNHMISMKQLSKIIDKHLNNNYFSEKYKVIENNISKNFNVIIGADLIKNNYSEIKNSKPLVSDILNEELQSPFDSGNFKINDEIRKINGCETNNLKQYKLCLAKILKKLNVWEKINFEIVRGKEKLNLKKYYQFSNNIDLIFNKDRKNWNTENWDQINIKYYNLPKSYVFVLGKNLNTMLSYLKRKGLLVSKGSIEIIVEKSDNNQTYFISDNKEKFYLAIANDLIKLPHKSKQWFKPYYLILTTLAAIQLLTENAAINSSWFVYFLTEALSSLKNDKNFIATQLKIYDYDIHYLYLKENKNIFYFLSKTHGNNSVKEILKKVKIEKSTIKSKNNFYKISNDKILKIFNTVVKDKNLKQKFPNIFVKVESKNVSHNFCQ